MIGELKMALDIIKIAGEALPVILKIFDAVKYTQENAKGKDPELKKEHCKIKLKENEIDTDNTPKLDEGIDFVKGILKSTGAFK
jgi:translation initiation factor IF-3